jgi:hypothetical protein
VVKNGRTILAKAYGFADLSRMTVSYWSSPPLAHLVE